MRFFTMKEFECRCGCGRVPMDEGFLSKLDDLRARYGKPIIISSGYRCPDYNARVSTTGMDGPHTTGRAVDVAVSRGDAYLLLDHAFALGFTGLGIQQKGAARFIHLDNLPEATGRPRPTVWSY